MATLSDPLAAYKNYSDLEDTDGYLALGWTRDERSQLAADLDAVIASELRAELDRHLESVNRYDVLDPFGENELKSDVASFFAVPAERCRVTCGAGVLSLLRALAHTPFARRVAVVGDVYPEFPTAVRRAGGVCSGCDVAVAAARPWGREITAVFLERPSLCGDHLSQLDAIARLCALAKRAGAIVGIDESNANYHEPSFSAVTLVPANDNLLVLRGFSKTYQLGSLRIGYCVSSERVSTQLRAAVAPLLVSSLSMRVA